MKDLLKDLHICGDRIVYDIDIQEKGKKDIYNFALVNLNTHTISFFKTFKANEPRTALTMYIKHLNNCGWGKVRSIKTGDLIEKV